MKLLFIFLFSINQALASLLPGNPMAIPKILSEGQKARALDICYKFKSKRSLYRTSYLGKVFNFKISNKQCDSEVTSEIIKVTLSEKSKNKLYFKTNYKKKFFDQIITDDFEYFKYICAPLFKKSEITDTFKLGKNKKIKVQFSNTEAKFSVAIAKLVDTKYIYQKIESYRLDTKDETLKTIGAISHYESKEYCPNKEIRVFTQELILK